MPSIKNPDNDLMNDGPSLSDRERGSSVQHDKKLGHVPMWIVGMIGRPLDAGVSVCVSV